MRLALQMRDFAEILDVARQENGLMRQRERKHKTIVGAEKTLLANPDNVMTLFAQPLNCDRGNALIGEETHNYRVRRLGLRENFNAASIC
jgi:hypothetical protein